MSDLVKRLRVDVFYGDERLSKMSKHNPLHKEAAARIEALERQVKAADALAAYVERDAKLTSIAFGTSETDAWKKQSPHAAELLEAYRAAREGAWPMTPTARATLYAIIEAALAAQVERRKRHE